LNNLNAIIFDPGLGGEFVFRTLITDSNLDEVPYKEYYQFNDIGPGTNFAKNKWTCRDGLHWMLHRSFVSKLYKEYFNLPSIIVDELDDEEFFNVVEFCKKTWYYSNLIDKIKEEHNKCVWEISKLDVLEAINKQPNVTPDTLWVKGHHIEKRMSKQYNLKIVNFAWPKSKRKVLLNLQMGKIGDVPPGISIDNTKFWDDKKYEYDENKLIINSYYLIIEPNFDQWNTLANFFDITCNFDWDKINEYTNKNKELYS